MSTKLLELDRRYFDAWHNQDADAIAAAFAENSVYTHPALPEPLVGGAAVAEWAKAVWTILPDFKLDLVSRDATENGIVVNEWVYRGTDTGPHPDGTPPTERAAKCPGVTISQYEGDKIRWQRVYMDRLDEQLQYGNVELKQAQHVQGGLVKGQSSSTAPAAITSASSAEWWSPSTQ